MEVSTAAESQRRRARARRGLAGDGSACFWTQKPMRTSRESPVAQVAAVQGATPARTGTWPRRRPARTQRRPLR